MFPFDAETSHCVELGCRNNLETHPQESLINYISLSFNHSADARFVPENLQVTLRLHSSVAGIGGPRTSIHECVLICFDVFCLCLEDLFIWFTPWKVSTGYSQTWVSGPQRFGLGEVRLPRRRWFRWKFGRVTPKGMRKDPCEIGYSLLPSSGVHV